MKKITFIITFLMLMSMTDSLAENREVKEKVVTTKFSFVSGSAKIADHYLNDQEHAGEVLGLSMEFGSFYKKSKNISWDFDMTYIMSPYSSLAQEISISNPSKTSFYALHNVRAEYGTYYNWNLLDNLNIKAGGSIDMLTGMIMGKPDYVNNLIDFDFQLQLKAAAGIRYGWNFKKFGLFLQGDIAVPLMGTALGGSVYQGVTDGMVGSEILPATINMLHFTSFHNLTGFNTELELDIVFGNTTLFITTEYYNRWWNLHDVQNYRKFNLSRIGLMVDLVARNRHNSANRFF